MSAVPVLSPATLDALRWAANDAALHYFATGIGEQGVVSVELLALYDLCAAEVAS
jgi:hypothetical protein